MYSLRSLASCFCGRLLQGQGLLKPWQQLFEHDIIQDNFPAAHSCKAGSLSRSHCYIVVKGIKNYSLATVDEKGQSRNPSMSSPFQL